MGFYLARTHKYMKRTDSMKSHSWWWDSYVSPKNSKWLAENLEQMDHSVKRMLKLIEEDADSFAKKAEMYYQKRPELISLVEEFYRMYRSLAERYDHVTGELRRNMPSDLQSQGSGISDITSELPSSCPSPDQRPSRSKSGRRAPGFDVFLGSAGNSLDRSNKEGDESSTLDSESESDDSSVNNYSGVSGNSHDEQGLQRRIYILEAELRDVKEKLRMQEEENTEGSVSGETHGNSVDLLAKIAEYEEELRRAKDMFRLSEEEIARLRTELQKYNPLAEQEVSYNYIKTSRSGGSESGISDSESKVQRLQEELEMMKEKLWCSEKEVANLKHELESNGSVIQGLQEQLGLSQKEVPELRGKLDKEKREVLKLQDRISRYKASLSDREQEIRGLRETISNANKSLSDENLQLQSEISKLTKERTYLEDNLKEWDLRCQSLEDEIRRVIAVKNEMEGLLKAEIEQLNEDITERERHLEELNKSLEAFKFKNDMLLTERDELNTKVIALAAEISSRDDRIDQLNKHLHQLHMEHVELISGTESAHKQVEELRSGVQELEREVERQKAMISQGAEEKREAIRQLCFSLEHYRNGYHRLRQAMGNKRLAITAS